MEEQGITSRTVSTRPDTPSEYSTTCGGPLTTAQRPSWEDLKIYQNLLYGFECWRMTESDITKLSVFHTTNLRRILRIFWPDTISNQQLLARCNQDSMETIIMGRRWRWNGHVMRREQDNITNTALHWTPEGKRKRWRPRNTWHRTVEAELETMQHTWGTIQKLARNRQTWRSFLAVLRATRHNGHEWVWWVNGRTLDLKNSELV